MGKVDASEKKVEENTKYDELELRNRTVVETLSPLDELGQDKKAEAENGKSENGNKEPEFDTLELRNRTVTETLSPVEDLGQDHEEPSPKKQKFDTLSLRGRDV